MERFTQHTPNGASLILGEPKTQAEAAEIYELCCRHGTTYIKNYLKEKYGVGAKKE